MIASTDSVSAKGTSYASEEGGGLQSVRLLFSRFPGRRRLFFPVIHIINDFDAVFTCAQVRIAVENGADGVFLLQGQASAEGCSYVELPRVFSVVRQKFPDLWIGLNFMAPDPLPHIPVTCDALWVDKGIAFATKANPEDKVEVSSKLLGLLKDRGTVNPEWKGLIFPGFFFKGTNRSFAPDATPEQKIALIRGASEQLAALGPDVICCTSGPGTGSPLEHDRATLYRDFVKGPIAVASGVTNENVHETLPKVDIFMVGTGIEEPSCDPAEVEFFREAGLPPAVKLGHLNPSAVRTMSDIIHSYAHPPAGTGEATDAEVRTKGAKCGRGGGGELPAKDLKVDSIISSDAILCKAQCGYYGCDSNEGYCSTCFKQLSSDSINYRHQVTSASATGSRPNTSFETKFSKQLRVPTQFDAYKLPDGLGNQCSWIAHQFALRSTELVASAEEGNDAAFLAIYNTCMSMGSSLRRAHCASGQSLPVGENVDDEAVLEVTAASASLDSAPSSKGRALGRFQIIAAAPGSIFHQQLPLIPVLFPALANRILKCAAENRHGPNSTAADFRSALAALPACGSCILERHIESMTIIRTSDLDVDSERAFLICDSHSAISGLTSLTGAVSFVFRLIPRGDFPLTFATIK